MHAMSSKALQTIVSCVEWHRKTWRALSISPMDSARHVSERTVLPRFLSLMESYAMASTIHWHPMMWRALSTSMLVEVG